MVTEFTEFLVKPETVLNSRANVNLFYNRIAGTSVERLAALSDGIFGVAMTLLLLDLHVPAKELIDSEAKLWSALAVLVRSCWFT